MVRSSLMFTSCAAVRAGAAGAAGASGAFGADVGGSCCAPATTPDSAMAATVVSVLVNIRLLLLRARQRLDTQRLDHQRRDRYPGNCRQRLERHIDIRSGREDHV